MKLNELKAEIARNEMTMQEFAKAIKMAPSTMWRRLEDGESFTLKEITTIANTLSLTGERVLEIFFNQDVS